MIDCVQYKIQQFDNNDYVWVSRLSPTIVPDRQFFLVQQSLAWTEYEIEEMSGNFLAGIEFDFTRRCDQRVAGQDGELQTAFASPFFQQLAQIDFVGGEHFLVKPADVTKRVAAAYDQCTGCPAECNG